jgi:exopolysaccharide biosynthesis polyprenyl glycosylphosphotransferase
MLIKPAFRRILALLTPVVDFLLLNLSLLLSWWLRFHSGFIPLKELQPLGPYLYPGLFLSILWLFIFNHFGLYRIGINATFLDEGFKLLKAVFVASLATMALTFPYRGFSYSRLVLLFTILVSLTSILISRVFLRWLKRELLQKGIGVSRLLILGTGEIAQRITETVSSSPCLVGYLTVGEDPPGFSGRVLGKLNDLRRVIRKHDVDEAVLTIPHLPPPEVWKLLKECEREGVLFEMVPDVYELLKGRVEVEDSLGIPLLSFQEVMLKFWQRVAKKGLDLLVSALGLVLFFPLIVFIAILIKSTSKGSVFFRQLRVGRGEGRFYMLKFRTMVPGAEKMVEDLREGNEAQGPIFKIKDDPRVTPIGRFLRRFSLDELPQLINVFKGEMSLVGPRPPLPREVEHYQSWQKERLNTRPGMTGLWQVSGRSNLSFEEMFKLDIYYIENWSLWLDLKIMLKTIPAVFLKKGAY